MTKTNANICILHPTLPDDQLGLIRDIAEVLEGAGHTARPLEASNSVNGGLLVQLQAADWVLVLLTKEQRSSISQNPNLDKVLRKKILSSTVMTVRLADPAHVCAPLHLASIQWADLSDLSKEYPSNREDAEQVNTWKSWLTEQCKGILERITEGSNVEPQLAQLKEHLKPAEYTASITSQVENIAGREWLDNAVNQWLESSDEPVCLLQGPMGIGKSAFSAHLAECYPKVVGTYFCDANSALTQTPKEFIRTLAFQLATQAPEYRAWLLPQINEGAKFSAKSLERMNTKELARELIFNAVSKLVTIAAEGREKLLIIIDGIDKSTNNTSTTNAAPEPDIVALLSKSFRDYLPPYIRILITSRKKRGITSTFTAKTISISQDDERHLEDVAQYIRQSLNASRVKEGDLGATVDAIKDAAQGSMLYAGALVNAFNKGEASLPLDGDIRLAELESHYLRMMQELFDPVIWRKKERGLAPADIARELAKYDRPLPKSDFGKAFGLQKRDIGRVLAPLYPIFLHGKNNSGEETIAFIHGSFPQWLTAPLQPHDFQI